MAESEQNWVVALPGGVSMPLVGFGTWQVTGARGYDAMRSALDVGYRHFDTATMYGNEDLVGRAVRDSAVDRRDVFITTKLPPSRVGRERATIEASLRALDMTYVDLWLIHWPPGNQARTPTWRAFLAARDDGLTRAIGVSNYDIDQIDELTQATGETPSVNQIRWGPSLYDARTAGETRERGVVLEGYSPFKTTNLRDRTLAEIAAAHGVSTGQVVLRWHLEHGFVVIPKSERPDRIANNFDVFSFSLTPEEVARIDGLGAGGRRRRR